MIPSLLSDSEAGLTGSIATLNQLIKLRIYIPDVSFISRIPSQ